MKFSTWWTHFKLQWFGDEKELEGKGMAVIPCVKCDKPFVSYTHYGDIGYIYDTTCNGCAKK